MARKTTIGDYFEEPESYEDIDRIAKALWGDSQGRIVDKDTYDMHFKEFIGDVSPRQERYLKPAVFQQLKKQHSGISNSRLFTKAGGKDLNRDRKTTAKEVTTSKTEYVKKGASKVDLKGYDTKQKTKYNYPAIRQGKVIYARKTFVSINGKKHARYRDNKGRFVSRKTN